MPDRCRSCGARIRWVRTERGTPMPLDAEPDPGGNVVLLEDGRARVVAGPLEVEVGTELWMPHHATCPQAATWRGRKR